ncbi:hsp70-binding protein 1 [Agrilus planipennis]|uniref:Hsp70-binding protein 1 n=1 Tax=Agrilus planipennis TaxID=224129 RepID=A0A1W4X300_AGRPL|nr:hsp70-binding protein 1 [Agrilus planipennis]
MPGIEKSDDKNKIAGAIEYPRSNIDHNVPQPAQPTNLQGLLRFAMEATKAEDPTHDSHIGPMDEERKRFLEQALQSLTINVIDVLKEQIEILKDIETEAINDQTDITRYLNAFEKIKEHIDHIDIANDFHKIGGFVIFKPCLMCVRPEIRAEACSVLAELCQSNPYCQRMVLETDLLADLLAILDTDEQLDVTVKALYAISCIVRHSAIGYQRFIQHQGLNIMLKTLQKDNDKLRTKAAFLLSSICESQSDAKNRLVFLNYLPVLISLISKERKESHEHLLSLLLVIVQDNSAAILECRNPKYQLEEVLLEYLKQIKGKPESQEEEEYCKTLILILNPEAEI